MERALISQGSSGPGVSSSTFQQPPGLCFLHILCWPFSGKLWLPCRHPRWILEALSLSQLLFLCAWVLGIPGQGNRLDVTSSSNPS